MGFDSCSTLLSNVSKLFLNEDFFAIVLDGDLRASSFPTAGFLVLSPVHFCLVVRVTKLKIYLSAVCIKIFCN